MSRLTQKARRVVSCCLRPLIRRAARAYIAGEHLSDALAVRARLAEGGVSTTIGYWDSEAESAEQVTDAYLAALDPLSGSDDYLSIKVPALRFLPERVAQVARAAKDRRVRLHCDSHGIEDTQKMQALIELILVEQAKVSYTLPGRWQRSLADADWASERGLSVRVVKGQWTDPADPQRDMRAGFLEVIDRLSGRANHVAVASHDLPLASEAIRRLQAAGTPCSLELLYGLPMRASLDWAMAHAIPARVYVAYGAAYLPYALGRLKQNPRMAWWLLRDMLESKRSAKSSADLRSAL